MEYEKNFLLGIPGNADCGDEVPTGVSSCRWANGLGLKTRVAPIAPAESATDQAKIKYQYELDRLAKLTLRKNRVVVLATNDFIDYIFLTGLQRTASEVEKTDLKAYFATRGYLNMSTAIPVINANRHDEIAQIIFD